MFNSKKNFLKWQQHLEKYDEAVLVQCVANFVTLVPPILASTIKLMDDVPTVWKLIT